MSLTQWILRRVAQLRKPPKEDVQQRRMVLFENQGHCPICDTDVTFTAHDEWLRDHYTCSNCGSIPRERALMHVIQTFFPHWEQLAIHESSPSIRGASTRISTMCKQYIPSQFFPDTPLGSVKNGIRCENLEALTFADDSIDLHITQDVMEHVLHPSKVWKEIARTLKPGGAHIFTVPIVNKTKPSNLRARVNEHGQVIHIFPSQYHGNPISDEGSLVTVDWGFDICKHIFDSCGLFTHIINMDDLTKGIRAEYVEVLMTQKPADATSTLLLP